MFDVILRPPAERYYDRQSVNVQKKINKAIDQLEIEPRWGSHIRRLSGSLEGLHRMRVGNLRIIYRVFEIDNEVEVLAIGPRGDIY